MPRNNNRGPDGRFLSIATPNPVRMSCNNTTEITTMSTTTPTPALASILATVEAGLSDRVLAAVDARVATLVGEEVTFHVARAVPAAIAAADLNSTLRERAEVAATAFAREFAEAEAPVIREVVIEQTITSVSARPEQIRDYVVANISDRMASAVDLATVQGNAVRTIIDNYYYDGCSRIDRIETAVSARVLDEMLSAPRMAQLLELVATKLADRLTSRVATQVFGLEDAGATASSTPDAEARV